MVSTNPTNSQPVPRRRPPPRVVEVRRVERITPRMVRITLGGRQLKGFQSKGPAEHVRIFMPDPETGELLMPVEGPEGLAFPADRPRPMSRAYTPRRWDADACELDVDIALHEHGPGAAWASNVTAGDTVVIGGSAGGAYFLDAEAEWYVIGGDEAALPAICTLLEALPPTMRAQVYAEVHDADEEQELSCAAPFQVTWLHRENRSTPGRLLAEAMKVAELPEGDGRIWVSCEAGVMREIRKHFIEDRGLDRSVLRTQGYWKQGEVNHPDHDMGDDV
ncbi:MAG: siderophore-interacting protein [Chloroflexi bacterium]|nr:siderophore-interacting protein [Chloroflexota bacterium]